MTYKERTLQATLRRNLKTFPAALVTGPRQSGKTTLLRHAFGQDYRFISLENPDIRARAANDPVAFFRENPPPVILDEVQYVPHLLNYIKTFIDEKRRPGQWLMTGSQGFSLMKEVSQSLAGRIAVLTLLPFSMEEYLPLGFPLEETINALLLRVFEPGFERVKKGPDPGNWLLRGSYPEPRSNPKVDISVWCSSYIQTYLERDVRSLLRVGDLNAFERFLRLCAARTGQILNLSDLARDTGITMPTAKSWLSALEASHEVFLLQPYFKNYGKRLVKAPKLYFMDTALAAYLTGLTDEKAVIQGPMAGALMETAVVSAWRKAFLHRGEQPAMYYWRSSDGLEVDLIIERNNRLYPMEIKLTSTLHPRDADALEKWIKISETSYKKGVVFCGVRKWTFVTSNVQAIPWDSL